MNAPASHIFALTPDSLAEWCEQRAMPRYRASQILEWVYAHAVIDPAAMSNLSKRDRETLARDMTFLSGDIVRHQSATDGTQKLLIQWADDATPPRGDGNAEQSNHHRVAGDGPSVSSLPILRSTPTTSDSSRQTECVMIPALGGPALRAGHGAFGGPALRAGHGSESRATIRRTACISSQVGCPVGCRFCASGLSGLDGNLSAGRIVEQVWLLDQLVKGNLTKSGGTAFQPVANSGSGAPPAPQDPGARITNVVFMGMGEPLANFQAVLHAVRTIAADWGMGISARRITISTVGLPRAIEKLAEQLDLPVTLALSLHAPSDDLRRRLIPWAEYTTIDDLLLACRAWFEKTGREITLEYILLAAVNDQPEHAAQLATVARSLRANVNLIRYNEVSGIEFTRPRTSDVRRFQEILRERGVNAHIRASRGRDIAAACGQLRHESARSR